VNAVVNKTILEEGIVIAGVAAKKLISIIIVYVKEAVNKNITRDTSIPCIEQNKLIKLT